MSEQNTSSIHFDLFKKERAALRDKASVSGYMDSLSVVSTALMAMSKAGKIGRSIDEMLEILHASAVRNKDYTAIYSCEVIAKRIQEMIK